MDKYTRKHFKNKLELFEKYCRYESEKEIKERYGYMIGLIDGWLTTHNITLAEYTKLTDIVNKTRKNKHLNSELMASV